MLFDDDYQMNDGPVSDYREEGLQGVGEESGRAATNRDSSDKAKGHEGNAGDVYGAGAKVLGV